MPTLGFVPMGPTPTPRVAVLPLRTILLVVAAFAVIAAFVAIADAFLIVFVGIFLALVFEGPVRFVMAKTGLSVVWLRRSRCSGRR